MGGGQAPRPRVRGRKQLRLESGRVQPAGPARPARCGRRAPDSARGGGGAGKVNVQDLSFTKFVDASSTDLMMACCNGKHFKEALLTVRKAGENPVKYIKIKMEEVLISKISLVSRRWQHLHLMLRHRLLFCLLSLILFLFFFLFFFFFFYFMFLGLF